MAEKIDKYPSCQKDYVKGGIPSKIYKPEKDATILSGNEAMLQSDSVKSPDDMTKKAQEEIKAHRMPL